MHQREALSNTVGALNRVLAVVRPLLDRANQVADARTMNTGGGAVGDPSIRTFLVRPNRKLQANDVDEVVRLYESGQALAEIAASFAMHRQTIRRHLVSRQVRLRQDHVPLRYRGS